MNNPETSSSAPTLEAMLETPTGVFEDGLPVTVAQNGDVSIRLGDLWRIATTPDGTFCPDSLLHLRLARPDASFADTTSPPRYSPDEIYTFADERLRVEPAVYSLFVDDILTPTTMTELSVITVLAKQPGVPIKTSRLAEEIGMHPTSRTVNQHICSLRKKLPELLGDPWKGAIQTVRGIGFLAMR